MHATEQFLKTKLDDNRVLVPFLVAEAAATVNRARVGSDGKPPSRHATVILIARNDRSLQSQRCGYRQESGARDLTVATFQVSTWARKTVPTST